MVFRCGNVELDEKTREIRREGNAVPAEPKVIDLVFHLVRHRDRPVTKQELLDAIWAGAAVGDAALARCVSLARKALGDPELIKVVHGRGYRFVGELVEPVEAPESTPRPSQGPRAAAPPAASDFVGRGQALSVVEERVVAAVHGRGGSCFVYGEAGIGKTRFLLELAPRVSTHGVLVLRGESSDAEGAPAFWPWLQVLRKLLLSAAKHELSPELGSIAAELSRIISVASLDEGAASLDEAPALATSLRNRLLFFEQIADVLGRFSAVQALTLLLDDLHQADLPSLHLLSYLARVCVDQRILLVGTYRDAELAADAARSAAVAPAWRAQASSIELRGLSVANVEELVHSRLNVPNPGDLAASLHEKTGGNPFFLTQLMPLLVGEGALGREIELPRGVRDVIRRQIRGLGPECGDVLGAAAVFGARFDASWLGIAGHPVGPVLHWLQRAVASNLLRQAQDFPSSFEFIHGLVREQLYEDLDAEKRVALHQKVAYLFESLPGLDEEHRLAALVHHFGRALPLGTAEKALTYAMRAGTHALSRYGYEMACDYLEGALRILESGAAGDEETLFSVLLDLGHARAQVGHRDLARATFDRGAELARRAGSADGLARVALRLMSGVAFHDLMYAADQFQIDILRNALEALGPSEPRLAAILQARLAIALHSTVDWNDRSALFERVDELVRTANDDDEVRAELSYSRLCSLWRPENLEQRVIWADDALRLCERTRNLEHVHGLHVIRFAIGVELGDVGYARAALDGFRCTCVELHIPVSLSDGLRAVLMFLEGKLADADALCRTVLPAAQRTQLPGTAQGVAAVSSMIHIELGHAADVAASLHDLAKNHEVVPGWRALLAMALAKAGRLDEAATEFEKLAEKGFPIPRDTTWLGCMAMLSVVCSALQDEPRAAFLSDTLTPFAERYAVAGLGAFALGSVHHFLGLLRATCRDPHAAALHFESAISANTRLGAPLFVAYTQHEYATLLRSEGPYQDPSRAAALEASALETAQRCGAIQLQREMARTIPRRS